MACRYHGAAAVNRYCDKVPEPPMSPRGCLATLVVLAVGAGLVCWFGYGLEWFCR